MTINTAPKVEHHLAHALLIELLAYQFASPVRWIETQDVIFGLKSAKRVVEIGPGDTLRVMAQRTLAAKYDAYDAAHSIQRQVLTLAKDAKEICYEVDSVEETLQETPTSTTLLEQSPPSVAPPPLPAAVAPPANQKAPPIPDAAISATDVVRVVIAHKLKKPLQAISLRESIKILVKGKSTLQNELLGDLGNEFGSLPENAEETPLDDLGGLLQTTHNGAPGNQTASLIAKMFSTKMPGGFNSGAARKHMEFRWGLGPQRQQGVLVLALTMQPASRLGKDDEAKAFLDHVAGEYATQVGIDLALAANEGDVATPVSGVILDSAALEAVTKDQRNLFTRQHELLAAHLKLDSRAADTALLSAQSAQRTTEAKLDLWNNEHGEFYGSGISPTFNSLKIRVYDSSWNWVREDVMSLYYDLFFARVKISDQELSTRKARIINRANQKLVDLLQHLIDSFTSEPNHGYGPARGVIEQLTKSCKLALDLAPVFKGTLIPTAPRTIVDAQGVVQYTDVPRDGVSTLEDYVQDMARRVRMFEDETYRSQHHTERIFGLVQQQHKATDDRDLKLNLFYDNRTRPMSPNNLGQITPPKDDVDDDTGVPERIVRPAKPKTLPFLHLKQRKGSSWKYCGEHTRVYLTSLEVAARSGISYQGKTALVTGTGAGSIGAMILEGLLSGGARVIATTSSFSKEVTEYYRTMYAQHGARGSQLVLLPFNQGSKQDVENLVAYIFNADKGLGWDLDYVLPFAAISENGNEIDSINSRSELSHRIMLTNLLRLLGFIKKQKLSRGYDTRPSQVILPLSPNHGTFGGDGLYSESKIALETLFNKWQSEAWGAFLTICGANIGWTRGTGLMSGNNIIAEEVERLGLRTFSQQEMAFNILGLMTPAIVQLCEIEPVYADLTGSMNSIPNLKMVTAQIRKQILDRSATQEALTREVAREGRIIHGETGASIHEKFKIEPRANLIFQFPQFPDFKSDIAPLNEALKGMVDLERVVVITGFSELGPWGNSRTRWEMEASGKFSLEGCIELAWIMGLIKHHNGPIKGRQGKYSGWVDSKTGDPINDGDVKSKYEKHILEHTGIRLVEHELVDGRDNRILQEIVLREDLTPFEASRETAEDLKKQHGEKVEIFPSGGLDEYSVRLKSGATIAVPKSIDNDHFVAGQIPSGWDARQYGIPEDIIAQVDTATLYVLVCTAEALLAAGITDPYELYQYVHVSEVGNCIGSGFGAAGSLRAMFKDRTLDKPVQNDILQETFINTLSAWVNMLLISSSGPLRTPVGACATAVESIDLGYDTIVTGKAQVCLVGACDSFQEETASEFGNMKATSNAKDELARGRTPKEMSRPTTTTRNGFVESEGCGIQVIMNAKLALEMGLPIWGIVALTATASDKIGRSVPAPGQGILTVAREEVSKYPSPLLNIKYRREQLEIQLEGIKAWQKSAMTHLSEDVVAMKTKDGGFDASDYMQGCASHIDRKAKRQRREALNSWGNDFWKQDPTIAPLRGALATWGLTIDDLSVASLHGTSTVANDKNEADVVSKQLRHLGRKKGNVILSICQKHLTGHPKGPAGAWMVNGALQVLNSGLVPGNRNADNVDKKLEEFDLMFYPSRSIQTNGVKAFSATSFGFGQKSAQVIGIHPKYLFATLDEVSYDAYKTKAQARQKRAYRYNHSALIANTLFQAKESPPYAPEQETQLLLSPTARVTIDKGSSSYSYSTKLLAPQKLLGKPKTEDECRRLVDQLNKSSTSNKTRIGVDIEDIDAINISSGTFVVRNFSEKEQAYCRAASCPQASFAGRWCAKEAVFKSLGIAGKGAGASMREIEITSDVNGAPCVTLHGDADAKAREASVKDVGVSISHSETQAVAVAMASL